MDNIPEINAQGNEVIRDFCPSDRYTYDFGQCSSSNGFAQVDTSQDASYYGTWANPFTLITVTYAEGDLIIVKCKSKESFVDELIAIKKWNEEWGNKFHGIDPGFNDKLKDRFEEIGLSELLH